MELKRVSKISQRYKDIVFGFIKEIQSEFPKDNPYFNGDNLVKHLILLYYFKIFESSILTEEEHHKFLDFLQENHKNIVDYPWKLIYSKSKDGQRPAKFFEKVLDHPNVLLLIGLNRGECVVGGYTKTGWKKEIYKSLESIFHTEYVADKDAFVFNFKSPKHYDKYRYPFILNVKQDEVSVSNAVGHCKDMYGTFGRNWIFSLSHVYDQYRHDASNNFEDFPHEGMGYLVPRECCCDFYGADFDAEVFQIES